MSFLEENGVFILTFDHLMVKISILSFLNVSFSKWFWVDFELSVVFTVDGLFVDFADFVVVFICGLALGFVDPPVLGSL